MALRRYSFFNPAPSIVKGYKVQILYELARGQMVKIFEKENRDFLNGHTQGRVINIVRAHSYINNMII